MFTPRLIVLGVIVATCVHINDWPLPVAIGLGGLLGFLEGISDG